MQTVELESFEPGNPFWHDGISVGMELMSATMNDKLKGIYVMSSGIFVVAYDFYIVDSHTGQRIGIKV